VRGEIVVTLISRHSCRVAVTEGGPVQVKPSGGPQVEAGGVGQWGVAVRMKDYGVVMREAQRLGRVSGVEA